MIHVLLSKLRIALVSDHSDSKVYLPIATKMAFVFSVINLSNITTRYSFDVDQGKKTSSLLWYTVTCAAFLRVSCNIISVFYFVKWRVVSFHFCSVSICTSLLLHLRNTFEKKKRMISVTSLHLAYIFAS